MNASREFVCPNCKELCIKDVITHPDGTVVHTKCGAKVREITDKMEKYDRSAITDSYD